MKNRTDQTIFITIGLPASGKTTWAKNLLNDYFPIGFKYTNIQCARVNNDDIRDELLVGQEHPEKWTPKFEKEVRQVRMDRIQRYLKDGFDVIVDNTHLNPKTLASLKTWLGQKFPEVKIIEKDFRDIPLQTCIDRDKERELRGEKFVGPEVILKMAYDSGLIPEVRYPIDWFCHGLLFVI